MGGAASTRIALVAGLIAVALQARETRLAEVRSTAGWTAAEKRADEQMKLSAQIDLHELTQSQWTRFTGVNPSRFNTDYWPGQGTPNGKHPVELVSWFECRDLLRGPGVRLPSEAEWEYAARAGAETPWSVSRCIRGDGTSAANHSIGFCSRGPAGRRLLRSCRGRHPLLSDLSGRLSVLSVGTIFHL